jgi:predicted transposase YdaD
MPIQIDIRKAPFYKWGKEEGLKEGKQEGLKEAILLGIQIKFGKSKVKELKTLLEKVDDLNHLKKIKRRIIEAKTWDDFVKVFRNHK